MIKFHLKITIFNPFFEVKQSNWRITARDKIDSVWFYDYDLFFQKVLEGMTYSDINKFKLNLFNWYKTQLSCIRVCQFINWTVTEGRSIVSSEFNVTSNTIAECIPSRKVRDQFFEYDCLREKYYVKSDFIFYLRKND